MFNLKRTTICLLLLTGIIALLPLRVVAQNLDVPSKVSSEEVEDALLYDANVYASNMGISLDEAVRRLQLQDIAGDLDAKLSEHETETFAGMWVENTPKFLFVVLFTRDGQEIINTYIPQELVDIVEVRTAKLSLAQLQQAQNEVHASIRRLDIPVESDINIFENRVEVYVAVVNRGKLDEAVRRGEVQLPDYVTVITVQEMGKPQTNIYGGLALSTCTSGFSVQQGGTKGVTTAGHCGNSQSFNGTSLIFVSEFWSGSWDIQWHREPGFTVTNKIQYSSNGSTRDITATRSRNNQLIGGLTCKYGMTTGYTCGYIFSKNNCPTWVPSCAGTFIRVNNTAGYPVLANFGDSGSPWFLGNTAYGTTSGVPSDDTGDAIYMAVNYIATGLGVSVMISS